MSQLNSLLESANPYKSLQGDAARLANKWGKTGLLEGIGNDTGKKQYVYDPRKSSLNN